MKKKFLTNINKSFFIFLFCFILLNTYISINILNQEKIKNDITRIHVVANSDSIYDQIVKLKVYEKINSYIKNLNLGKNIKQSEILSIIEDNSDKILSIANSTLVENRANYNSKLNIGKIKYDKKESITLDMPAGSYDSIKLVLGNGEGKNIWSLMFPNEENIYKLKDLNSILPGIEKIYNNYDLTSENDKEYSFKILDMLKKLLNNY